MRKEVTPVSAGDVPKVHEEFFRIKERHMRGFETDCSTYSQCARKQRNRNDQLGVRGKVGETRGQILEGQAKE